MIIQTEIIDQPYSGEYEERIYDITSPWNSSHWTWVKFINDDYSEWCGEFRGRPRAATVSPKHNICIVLTSDYLYQLDCNSGELIQYEEQPQYLSLSITPIGDILLADCYHIELLNSTLAEKIPIQSPIQMDMIKFHDWIGNKLTITCDEFLNWNNRVELELDCETLEITIIKQSKK